MPSDAEHLKKAEHNENFYKSFNLNNTNYLDWVVSGIFYSALHYIECYLATQNKHSLDHAQRNEFIRDDPNLGRDIYKIVTELKDDSQNGRYFMKDFTPGEIRQFIIPNLDELKEYLKKFIPQIRLS